MKNINIQNIKKCFLGLVVLFFCGVLTAQNNFHDKLKDIADIEYDGTVFKIKPKYYVSIDLFWETYYAHFGFQSAGDLQLYNTLKYKEGDKIYRFIQLHNNIPILNDNIILYEKDGVITKVIGNVVSSIQSKKSSVISPKQAVQVVLNQCNIKSSDILNEELNPQLFLQKQDDASYHSIYLLTVNFLNSNMSKIYYIDAETGKILNIINNIIELDGKIGVRRVLGQTCNNGAKGILVDSIGVTEFGTPIFQYNVDTCFDHTSPFRKIISTYNFDTSHAQICDVTHSCQLITDTLNNNKLNNDCQANIIHYAAEQSLNYFYDKHDRYSIDNQGYPIYNYVHDMSQHNACWSNITNSVYFHNDFANIVVYGHEFTHGIQKFSYSPSGFINQGESGAISEGLADIFGCLINYYCTRTMSWVVTGSGRTLSNPEYSNYPKYYKGNYWRNTNVSIYNSDNDYGGIHSNCLVLGYWFYLITQGGAGVNENNQNYNVVGMGANKSERIAYRLLTSLPSNAPTYNVVSQRSIEIAEELYGKCSDEYVAVINAWKAVGIEYCQPPTNLRVTESVVNNESQFIVQWDSVTNAEMYSVYINNIGQLTSDTSITLSNISQCETYCFTVQTGCACSGISPFSETICYMSSGLGNNNSSCHVPTNLSTSLISQNNVDKVLISWERACNADMYYIYLNNQLIDSTSDINYIYPNQDDVSYPCQSHLFAVKSRCEGVFSDFSSTSTIYYGTKEIPQNLIMHGSDDSEIIFYWDAIPDASYYNLYCGTQIIRGNLSSNSCTMQYTGGFRSLSACYTVTAIYGDCGESEHSSPMCIGCEAPSNITLHFDTLDLTQYRLIINWNGISNATEYAIYLSSFENGAYSEPSFVTRTTQTRDSLLINLGNMSGSALCVTITTTCDCGETEYSERACITLPYLSCQPPSKIEIKEQIDDNNKGMLVISWTPADISSRIYYLYADTSGIDFLVAVTSDTFYNFYPETEDIYCFRVKTYCIVEDSQFSEYACGNISCRPHLDSCLLESDYLSQNNTIGLSDLNVDNLAASDRVEIYRELRHYYAYETASNQFLTSAFKGIVWSDKNNRNDFWNQFHQLLNVNSGLISLDGIQTLINQNIYVDFDSTSITFFAERYNRSVTYWNNGWFLIQDVPDGYSTNFIEYDTTIMNQMFEAEDYALNNGFTDVQAMFDNAYGLLEAEVNNHQSSVCASVTVQFSQTMTMTREAFDGTLTIFNGHESTPMQAIDVNFSIKNPQGTDCTNLFKINTLSLDQITNVEGAGILNAQTEGVARFQFIPTKNAAPTQPVVYSFGGSFSFIDPFTNELMTYDLYPVDITVNPSPDLYVNYFMQRDIIGDDALTLNKVEPKIPADLGVIIHNKGFGTANNVVLETAQPQIIENERGLAINFEIIGASFNGNDRQLGMMGVDFGNIASNRTAVAEWWFTSSLLGHFVSYEAHVIHNNSYGNPDLSLVSGIDIHELTHTVYAYGNLDDGINDFLVNDVADPHDYPDSLYFSDGSRTGVSLADHVETDGYVTPLDSIIILTLDPSQIGWNYAKTEDPGRNYYELISCTREDGQVIPLSNVWQSFVTIPDGGDPVYENKLHIVDTLSQDVNPVHYTLIYRAQGFVLEIDSIENIPTELAHTPLQNVIVHFNKALTDSTFTYEDMQLVCQNGPNLMNNSVIITRIDDQTYNVDISSLTHQMGYFVLTVNTNNILDAQGDPGYYGKQEHWTQLLLNTAPAEAILQRTSIITGNFGYVDSTILVAKGFEWKNIHDTEFLTDTISTENDSVNTLLLTNLQPNTTYQYRAFMIIEEIVDSATTEYQNLDLLNYVTRTRTYYGDFFSFTTESIPIFEFSDTTCHNMPYLFAENSYNLSGIYADTLHFANGNDSIVRLTLTVNSTYYYENEGVTCANEPYVWENHNVNIGLLAAGTHTIWDSLTTANGCDSVYKLTLTVNSTYTENVNQSICASDLPYHYINGVIDTTFAFGTPALSTSYFLLRTAAGCDSLVTLTLTVNPTYNENISLSICASELPYRYVNGQIDTTFQIGTPSHSTSQFLLHTANNRDSIVVLTLTVNPTHNVFDYRTICASELPYHYVNGIIDITFAIGTPNLSTFNFRLHTTTGCDSIVTLTLRVNPSYNVLDSRTICASELPYRYVNGQIDTTFEIGTPTLSTSHFILHTTAGCDSVVQLTLVVNQPIYTNLSATICQSEPYNENGFDIPADSTILSGVMIKTRHTLSSQTGCDSTVMLTLTVNPTYYYENTGVTCANESYVWENHNVNIGLLPAGTHILWDSLTTANDCDSVYKLTLTVNPTYYYENEGVTCANDSYVWENHNVNIGLLAAGTHTIWDSLTTVNGCDSVYKLTLTVNPTYYYENEGVTCANESYVWENHNVNIGLLPAGTHILWDSLTTANGCDSIYKLTLTVNPTYYFDNAVGATCDNEPYVWENHNINIGVLPAGTHIIWDSLTTVNGCDSVYKLTLTVEPTYNKNIDATICASEIPYHYIIGEIDTTFQIGTPALSTSYFSLSSSTGCDSTVILTLTVNPSPTVTISGNTEIHAGESTTLNASGTIDYLWSTMETTPSILVIPIDTTLYSVIGTDENGCVGYDTVIVNVATGIADYYDLSNNILLFPNPATNTVELQITNDKLQIIEIEVMDMMGKLVKTTHALNPQSATINVSVLAAGTYFVRVTTSDGNVVTKKLVKQ